MDSAEFSLVASMDLLGASKAIEDGESNAAHYFNSFAKVAYPILSGFEKNIQELVYFTFSDSLFVVAPLDPDVLDDKTIRNFGYLMSSLIVECFLANIPLCGGISVGWVIKGTDPAVNFQSFIAGKALLEAYTAQESWDWVGIGFAKIGDSRRKIICNSILEKLKEVQPPLVHEYGIPIKVLNMETCKKDLREHIKTHAIAWPIDRYSEISDALKRYLDAAGKEPFEDKYKMTKEYIEFQKIAENKRKSEFEKEGPEK